MLVSPTEPPRLLELGKSSWKPEEYGCDILILGKGRRIGVQRKKFPEDFVSSLSDGRLERQLPLMTNLSHRIIVLEGYGSWTSDGELIMPQSFNRHQLTRKSFQGLLFSIMFQFQIPVLQVADIDATVETLEILEAWAKKKKHTSLSQRPGPKKDSFGSVSEKAMASHIMQGFPGVGVGTAGDIIEHFGGVPLVWTVTQDELLEVKGVGKVTVERLMKSLDLISTEGNTT